MSWCFGPSAFDLHNAESLVYRLRLQSTANVDYCLAVGSTLNLNQAILGPVYQPVTSALGISQTVVPQHAVPYGASSALALGQTVVHAGVLVPPGNGGGGGVEPFTATFDSNTIAGQPVYVVSDTNVDLADNTINYWVIGLAIETVSAGNTGDYITEGTVERGDWTPIVGTAQLTPGAVYYLDSTAGLLTATPTVTEGEHVVAVARAASFAKLDIEIAEATLL